MRRFIMMIKNASFICLQLSQAFPMQMNLYGTLLSMDAVKFHLFVFQNLRGLFALKLLIRSIQSCVWLQRLYFFFPSTKFCQLWIIIGEICLQVQVIKMSNVKDVAQHLSPDKNTFPLKELSTLTHDNNLMISVLNSDGEVSNLNYALLKFILKYKFKPWMWFVMLQNSWYKFKAQLCFVMLQNSW